MKTILTKKQLITAVIIVFILSAGVILFASNNRLKRNLITEKLRSEALLSQNMQLDKSLEQTKKNVADLKLDHEVMEKTIAETNQKISLKNAEINKLKTQNASLKSLQKKLDELEALKQKRDLEISELNKSLALAQSEKTTLLEKINTSAKAYAEVSTDNTILKAIISDNYRTEALRGRKERLTVNARKTNKLKVSFDLPGNIISKDIYFKVFTPEGIEYSSEKDITATISFSDYENSLLASTNQGVYTSASTQRVEMSFMPKQKLKEGIYRFNLYNGDRFLGSTQVKLK